MHINCFLPCSVEELCRYCATVNVILYSFKKSVKCWLGIFFIFFKLFALYHYYYYFIYKKYILFSFKFIRENWKDFKLTKKVTLNNNQFWNLGSISSFLILNSGKDCKGWRSQFRSVAKEWSDSVTLKSLIFAKQKATQRKKIKTRHLSIYIL